MSSETPTLQLAVCQQCGKHSYPANAWGCSACGAAPEQLAAVVCPGAVRLRNFVTIYAELVPGVPPSVVIGEVELAPGLIEEALLEVADESLLALGMALVPVPELGDDGALKRWRFRPLAEGGAA